MESPAPTDRVSECFCKDDSDITFRSCDGILFKVHRKNLESCSEGFSPPDGTIAEAEVVSLTEDGATLELLFQYMYPQRHPDLRKIQFEQLAELSEAAEKYQVYTAMETCHDRMEEAHSQHPFEVMMYAMKHGYADLMDKSELLALEVSPTTAFDSFKPEAYIAWTRYYAQWLDLLASFRDMMATISVQSPHDHGRYQNIWLMHIFSSLSKPAALVKSDSICDLPTSKSHTVCTTCKTYIDGWRNGKLRQGMEHMKKLSSFL
ncbi:hypothetical protein FIBSPDRAFT_794853 [Athelia psychrophila]|uniref:BTB domain-containing protein n=1 Tax=Athelia psychrophila TaxID=1759441 RepID=A0A166EU06_9AGAM|nr:hypothetical protein FIBSPDRAFT_794853 [Fibularhizoctonia sp. CBS 109695]